MSEEKVTKEVSDAEVKGNNLTPLSDPCDCSMEVDACCVKQVPSFFNNDFSTDDPRISYDPTCLCCVVEQCEVVLSCSGAADRTIVTPALVIKGCMPYQIETRFNDPAVCSENTGTTNSTAIVCNDTVCFDNAVYFDPNNDVDRLQDICDCLNGLFNGGTVNSSDVCDLIRVKGGSEKATLHKCKNFEKITTFSSDEGRCKDRFVRFKATFEINDSVIQKCIPAR
ncbi:hypothetical protein N780_07755 [Pontibacillus chungwhensis BH030062]|uniref:Uncharacterized protein n=1 Tax=Pontibacillus chungwhensis BH030062 TaxID=1385513 RepID=A0A0A2UU14_9BACI|nr:hypothetical protein [Pontibacillus chungwhensis]KGP89991.1 hypothetical protein N780_07755 [Pontibacillus chungwhensis BH030062]